MCNQDREMLDQHGNGEGAFQIYLRRTLDEQISKQAARHHPRQGAPRPRHAILRAGRANQDSVRGVLRWALSDLACSNCKVVLYETS